MKKGLKFAFFFKSVKIIIMRHLFLSFVCLVLFLLAPFWHLEALELEFTGGVNNLTFHPDRITGHSVSHNYKTFQSYPSILGDFIIKSNSFDKIGFKIHGSRDNILRNSLSAMLTTNWDYIKLEFGPFIGVQDTLNSLKKPELGIIGGLELAYPGIIFFSLNGSATFGSKYDFFSNNTRETAEARLGFWIPHVIPTLSASIKSYSNKIEELVEVTDELIRLQLSVEVYTKNFPLLLRFDAGYEILSRYYDMENADSTVTDKLSAIYAGFEAKIQVHKAVKVIIGFEIPVYCIAVEPMEKPIAFGLFKAHAGLGFNIY